MSFLRCSFCERRCASGVAHVYWFIGHHGADPSRVRQRLCLDCLASNVQAFATAEDVEELTCAACGISVEDDVYPIYFTYYLKGQEPVRGAMALCEDHQIELAERAGTRALELPDRYVDPADRPVAAPSPSAGRTLSDLGYIDRGVRRK